MEVLKVDSFEDAVTCHMTSSSSEFDKWIVNGTGGQLTHQDDWELHIEKLERCDWVLL